MKFLLQNIPFLAFLLLASCQQNVVFEAEQDLPDSGWIYADTLDFQYTVADTAWLYNLYLDFTYADTFPNQNLYVKLHTRFPDGRQLSKLKSFDFFTAQGEALGEGSGRTRRLRTLLQENAFFNLPGEYGLRVEQFTRRESLPGLRAVGLRVEKVKTR